MLCMSAGVYRHHNQTNRRIGSWAESLSQLLSSTQGAIKAKKTRKSQRSQQAKRQ